MPFEPLITEAMACAADNDFGPAGLFSAPRRGRLQFHAHFARIFPSADDYFSLTV